MVVGEEVQIEEETEAETEILKRAPDPGQPTAQQVEQHRQGAHVPYRSWCRWCVLGRGRGLQHRSGQASAIAIVSLDYFFMTGDGVKLRSELKYAEDENGNRELTEARGRGEVVKCLALKCSSTKILMAHVVPCKGADENGWVADLAARDIAWLGHTKVIIKADGEPALQNLVVHVLKVARVDCPDLENAGKERSPAYDSQSNGAIESTIRTIRGLMRTVRLCLEARLDKTIPVNHPILAWMLEHVCLTLNVTIRGSDGVTAWRRARGRTFNQQLVGFGESVLYKYPSKGPQHAPHGNVGALGSDGIFVGYSLESNTFQVWTPNGMVYPRSITRKPPSERWNAEEIGKVNATPGEGRERRERPRLDRPAGDVGPTAERVRDTPVRQMRINISDLKKFDHYDANCSQCQHIERYGRARPGGQHTRTCRQALVEKMQQTEAGRARLAAEEERTTKAMAEHIERADGRQRNTPATPAVEPAQPARLLPRDPQADGLVDGHALGAPAQREASRGTAPPEHARVVVPTAQEEEIDAWRDVQNGQQAPLTPPLGPAPASPDLIDDILEGGNDEEMGDEGHPDDDVNMDFIGSLEPSLDDTVSSLLLAQLGSLGRSYRREARQSAKALVSEIYSPPRVTALIRKAKMRHIMPGFALDITVDDPHDGKPWDFCLPEKRLRAKRIMREQKPYCLIGSPMCTKFSSWQALNAAKSTDKDAIEKAKQEAIVHLDFVAELYNMQIDEGRYFLHEHPRFATSWSLPSIQAVLRRAEVILARGDQCQYGAEIRSGPDRGSPIMKPTGFMTNSAMLARALSKRCEGVHGWCSRRTGGQHGLCSGKHSREAAKYPRSLCRAILRGVRDQLREDGIVKDGCFGMQVPDDDAEVERSIKSVENGYSGRYRDDLTGQVLRDDLVKEARAKELAFFHSKGVWLKVPKHSVRRRGGKSPISVRWVDVNKGDDVSPKYRSRLVARQIKALDASGQSYFAPAPPLEALRTVVSLAVTEIGDHKPNLDPTSPQRTQISLVDVKRAYFNATIDPEEPPTFVQLPAEDPDADTMCAQLLRHMYGTRPAADGWQEEYSTLLVSLGFRQGDACPNAFFHPVRRIACSVHGDDFTSSGPADALDWLEGAIGEHYELDIGPRLGPGPSDAKEGRVLNRIIRWCGDRIEYEADPRQIERLVSECGLEGAKGVATPGVKPTFKQLEEATEIPAHLATAFRGAAARGNYLAADRLDVQFACKEVCRWMSKPTVHAWEALKRVGRFLNAAPRLVYEYRQQSVAQIDVYVDTDWAGCPRTRKSTSGGCVMLGGHAVKHWSSTQQSISLSSGEAEFAGVIRGAGQGLGYKALLRDLGVEVPLRVWTDSSAAIGICSRQGLGKLRHLDTHTLWIQQAVRTRRIDLRKVDGDVNPADLLTKHSISRQRLENLVILHGCRYIGGRAESAPQVRKGGSSKPTMADADRVIGATIGNDVEANCEMTPAPIMPHKLYSTSDLDKFHPSIEAPDDENDLDDVDLDERDVVYQHGLRVAKGIHDETATQGRKRRPLACGGTGKEDDGGKSVQCLATLDWIPNSTSDPRRRAKTCHSHCSTKLLPYTVGCGPGGGGPGGSTLENSVNR